MKVKAIIQKVHLYQITLEFVQQNLKLAKRKPTFFYPLTGLLFVE